MISPPAPSASRAELLTRYEQLRESAVCVRTPSGAARTGAALLLRYGMAGWIMTAHTECGPDPYRPLPIRTRPAPVEIVTLLTELVLNQYREPAHA